MLQLLEHGLIAVTLLTHYVIYSPSPFAMPCKYLHQTGRTTSVDCRPVECFANTLRFDI